MSLPVAVTEDTRPKEPCRKFEGHTGIVRDVVHLPDGQQIMTCSDDGSLGVWNFQTGKQVANWRDGESVIWAIALSMDGKTVVSGSEDGVVRLWSIKTGKVIARWAGHTQSVLSLSWSRDGERVLSGSWDGTGRIWDVETGKTVLEIYTELTMIHAASFSPDSALIATGGYSTEDEHVTIWEANTGKLISTLKGHTDDVNCLAWSSTADGTTLCSCSFDCSVRVWNATTWQQIAVLTGHSDAVFGITIYPNGRILASASADGTVRLWNLEQGQPIILPLQHANALTSVSLSADGKLLTTTGWDKNAYTWDIYAIVREAGLHELLELEKSFLHADTALPRLDQQRESTRPNRLPAGFLADSPHHLNPSIRPLTSPLSIPHRSDTPAQPTFLQWALSHFFKHQHEGMELRQRRPAIFDVPFAPGRPRNYSAREAQVKRERKEKVRKANNSNIIQQPVGQSQATALATPPPDTVTLQVGCWTRLSLCIGCVSQYPNDR